VDLDAALLRAKPSPFKKTRRREKKKEAEIAEKEKAPLPVKKGRGVNRVGGEEEKKGGVDTKAHGVSKKEPNPGGRGKKAKVGGGKKLPGRPAGRGGGTILQSMEMDPAGREEREKKRTRPALVRKKKKKWVL